MLGGCVFPDSRFAEQPLVAPDDSGIAFVHDASLYMFGIRDTSGRVMDTTWRAGKIDPVRTAHFAGKRVFWSTRPLGHEVVSVFTLPPGRYELYGVVTSGLADDRVPAQSMIYWPRAPIFFDVEPHRVNVLGELFCHRAQCTFDTTSRKAVRDVLAWEIAQPHDEDDVAMWRTWLPAIEREVGP